MTGMVRRAATAWLVAMLATTTACNQVFGLDPPGGADDGDDGDADGGAAATDAAEPAEPDAPALDAAGNRWSAPNPITVAAGGVAFESEPTLSPDQLELYFAHQANGFAGKDLWRATRASLGDAWNSAAALPTLSSMSADGTPRLTTDGLRIYFSSDRGGAGGTDIWVADRVNQTTASWIALAVDPGLSTDADDRTASPCEGRKRLVLASNRGGTRTAHDLYESDDAGTRALDLLNSPGEDLSPYLTADCLTLYFASDRQGSLDLYVSARVTPDDPWSLPVRIDELATSGTESDPWVSPDQRHLVFTSAAFGRSDVVESFR